MSFYYEPDHAGQMLRAVPSMHTDAAPWLRALLLAIGDVMQCYEDEVFDYLVSSQFDVATGATLDQFAGILGIPRRGLDDDTFRHVIRWRAQARKSRGARYDILRIQQLPGLTVDYDEIYPAAIELNMTFDTSPDAGSGLIEHLQDGLDEAVAMGVGVRAVEAGQNFFQLDTADRGLDAGLLSRRIL